MSVHDATNSPAPRVGHFIGGREFVTADDPPLLDVHDPASGRVVSRLTLATASDVDAAVSAAGNAFAAWRDTSLSQRTNIMFALRELLHARADELATCITREHGKVLDDARGEVQRGLEVVEFACGLAHLLKGEYAEQVSRGVDVWSVRQPLGVVAGITPFNFPAMVPLWMIPIALACGNTFVLKPSEKAPGPSMLLASLLREAGVPDGVFNVVHGDAVAVDRLLAHPDVAAISSVSSTPVARHIYEHATRAGKRVQALGGAKNHLVVLPDADLDLAADAAVSAAFGSAGQRCMAISVLVAVGDCADQLTARIAERMRALIVGPGTRDETDMGPVITRDAQQRLTSVIDNVAAAGARILVDGRAHVVESYPDGFWFGPTLIDHVEPGMPVYDCELFGPVLCVCRVDTWDDALALVNASPFANGVALFTNDGGAARRFQRDVEVGMVGINVPIPVPMAYFSFGGWKDSLFGDTHMHGMDGIRFFTRQKVVTGRWADPSMRGVRLGFPTSADHD